MPIQSGSTAVDALTLEVVDAHLTYAVREMRSTMIRMAYSPIVTETHDMACAITNLAGEVVAMNDDLPMHMFDIRYAVATVNEKYGDDIHQGDQFLVNDPWECGSHLNDVTLLMPYFQDGKPFLWMACVVHWGDVGGPVPGSVNGAATEIFHEGIRIPLTRVTEELLELLLANFRQPFEIRGVFAAQSICMKLATKRLDESCAHFGAGVVASAVEQLLTNEERKARSRIAQLPDGDYYYEDYLENGGAMHPEPILFMCKMTVAGDHLTFDFTGTSEQNAGVANCTIADTNGGVFESVDTFMSPGGVSNSGAARAWSVVAPEGSAVNVQYPNPNGGYATVMFGAIHALVNGCLSQVMPGELCAITTGSANNTNVAGSLGDDHEGGDPYWLIYEYPPGGWGATDQSDGSLMTWAWFLGDIPVIWPVERLEALNPVRAHFNELYVDSGGPGRQRGGLGIRRAYEVLAPGEFTVMGTDGLIPRPGMCGGYAGAWNWVGIIRDGKPLQSAPIQLKTGGFKVVPGDLVLYLVSGGGGYGDPLDRPAESVLADIRDGYVSVTGAREDYGVIVSGDVVDQSATDSLRERIRAGRLSIDVIEADVDEFGDSRRRARLSPEFAGQLGVTSDDIVEYVNPIGGHVRAWVTLDDSLIGSASPLGPRVRSMLGATAGSPIHVRTPLTYAMRQQPSHIAAEPPLGRLFIDA